jgi:solute carrier family 35 protein
MFGEYIVLKKRQSIPIVISVVFIAIGAIVAGMGDLEFSFIGYLLGMLSCISQAGYLLFVAKKEEETGMSTFSLLFYNSAISLPFVVLMIFGTGELSGVLAYPRLFDFDFLVRGFKCTNIYTFVVTGQLTYHDYWSKLVLLGSSLLGSFLNYAIFLCATVTSPLTLTVSGMWDDRNIACHRLCLFISH